MATLDVLTLNEAKEALKGLRGPSEDSKVAGLVTAVSKRLDADCGPIVVRSVTETHRGASGMLFLGGKPFTGGAFAITEAWSSETPAAVLSTDYVVDSDATVTRWAGYWGSRVTVVYDAGRFATTELVEEPFKTAARMLLQHWWRPAEGGGSETFGLNPGFLATGIPSFGMPNAVRDVLAGELLPPAVA